MSGGFKLAKSYKTAFIRVTCVNETEDGMMIYTSSDIEDILSRWAESASITYWFIEHPADEDVSTAHYHIVIKFRSPMPFDTIKNRFPYGFIENAKSIKACVQYLVHLNDKSKQQYSWDDIKTNCKDMTPYKILSSSQQEVTLYTILESINEGKIREYNQFTEIPIDIWSKHKSRIENALIYYRERICMDADRDIEVIFMSGKAGIGKTTFAKRYCEIRHLKPCISSSSNDPLQDYKGEPVLILDDLRDDAFKYHDFLKFLDNHTKSTTRSRYHNKAFIGQLIIITSTKPINEWYFDETSEDKHQLRRRVKNWLKFDGEKIYAFEYDDKTKRYEPKGTAVNPIVLEAKKRKELFLNVFDAMGVEFTPSDRKYIETTMDNMTDDEWKKAMCEDDDVSTEEEKPKNRKQKLKKKIDSYLPVNES